METILLGLALIPALMWLGLAFSSRRPFPVREVLDADPSPGEARDLGDVTVLIPARDEAEVVPRTLPSVAVQGHGLTILLVDDGSADGTAERALEATGPALTVLPAGPLPEGWGGKVWALEEGRRRVTTPYTLLLDADVALAPGIVATLRDTMRGENRPFLSLMAAPPLGNFWEDLLMPAFIYFFRILYPFGPANSPSSGVAAAAGGCILLETRILEEIGGFAPIRDAVIDDCALARRVKDAGYPTWIGLTRSARSVRRYGGLSPIWNMVARTAFTQLRYSAPRLALCTLAMVLAFLAPVAALATGSAVASSLAAATLFGMAMTYVPTLRFYGRPAAWSLCLPLVATLYLGMTWTSALRYWNGERSRWKGRVYGAAAGAQRSSAPGTGAE